MAPKKRGQQPLEGFVSQSTKRAKLHSSDQDSNAFKNQVEIVSASPDAEAYVKEVPGRIATHDAAAAVDADPPLTKLLNCMGDLRQTGPGESAVYWMRNEDIRGRHNVLFA
jgi:hypothetical protein